MVGAFKFLNEFAASKVSEGKINSLKNLLVIYFGKFQLLDQLFDSMVVRDGVKEQLFI